MKRVILLTLLLICVFQGFAQTAGISYQAVILNPNIQELPGEDADQNILANTRVVIKFSIINEVENTEFTEYHETMTDEYGMINLVIGTGTATRNSFDYVQWDGEQKKLRVEIDFSGRGALYSTLSEQDLMFMPQPVTGRSAQAIIDNTSTIEAETIRALAAEATIQTNMDQNIVDTDIAIASNTTAITAESTRAQAKEANMTSAIISANTNISNNATNISENDSNIADNKVAITVNASGINANTSAIGNNTTNVALKANIASPTFTGTPAAPTATAGTNTTQLATTAFVKLAVTNATSGDFVDLTTNQTIAGTKIFSADMVVNGVKIGRGTGDDGQNTAIGTDALGSGTGTRNTGIGFGALLNYSGTSFDNNTGVGYQNMVGLTTGYGNTSVGAETMFNVAGNDHNTAIGNQTLMNAAGSENTALGANSGTWVTTGSKNTFLGRSANISDGTYSNATAIGYNAVVTASNTIQLGNGSVTDVITNGRITTGAITLPNTDGTANQVLKTDGSGSLTWSTPSTAAPVREVADEFSATAAQTSFTLTQSPSSDSKVKMYINGIRISTTAYGVSGTTITYVPANNGGYALSTSDRIQFDFYY